MMGLCLLHFCIRACGSLHASGSALSCGVIGGSINGGRGCNQLHSFSVGLEEFELSCAFTAAECNCVYVCVCAYVCVYLSLCG